VRSRQNSPGAQKKIKSIFKQRGHQGRLARYKRLVATTLYANHGGSLFSRKTIQRAAREFGGAARKNMKDMQKRTDGCRERIKELGGTGALGEQAEKALRDEKRTLKLHKKSLKRAAKLRAINERLNLEGTKGKLLRMVTRMVSRALLQPAAAKAIEEFIKVWQTFPHTMQLRCCSAKGEAPWEMRKLRKARLTRFETKMERRRQHLRRRNGDGAPTTGANAAVLPEERCGALA
jgi:hypothetical protein